MTPIDSLIGKLEQATGPDRELDLECWWWGKANHDGTQPMDPQYKAANLRMNDAPRYTASLDSALTLFKTEGDGLSSIWAALSNSKVVTKFDCIKWILIGLLKARTSMESNHE